MAQTPSSSTPADDDLLPIEQIIFSCSICQASPSEVYASVENNQGFHSGSGHDDGVVTKMWIASCSHVTCSKHLKDGAIPFHSKDRTPQAVCPRCTRDHGDDTLKEVYAVHGLSEGEYDPVIPAEWLQSPPVKLDTSIPGMSAVRFQYVALSHYARHAKAHWTSAQRKLSTMETSLFQERKSNRQSQKQVLELQSRVASLQKSEVRLKKWEARKAVIHHTLGQVNEMVNEIDVLRKQLRKLGYSTPTYRYRFDIGDEGVRDDSQDHNKGQQPVLVSLPSTDSADHRSSSARKRKRECGEDTDYHDPGINRQAEHRGSSRDLMPPPLPRPQRSPRQAEPTQMGDIRGSSSNPRDNMASYENKRPPAFNLPAALPYDARSQEDVNHVLRRYVPAEQALRPEIDHVRATNTGQRQFHQGDAVESFSQLAIGSPPMHSNVARQLPFYRQAHAPGKNPERSIRDPRIHTFDEAYGSVADQLPATHRGVVTNASSRGVDPTPAPKEPSQRPGPSVISPFFSRNAAGVVTAQRPPARDYIGAAPGRFVADYPASEYSHAPSNAAYRRLNVDSHGGNGRIYIDAARSSRTEPLQRHRIQDSRAGKRATQHYQASSTSQRSYANQYHPRDVRQPVHQVSQAASVVQSVSRHGRVSLPPSSLNFGHLIGSQDQALSQISGVRGLTSQIGKHFASAHDGMPSRNLFSAVSARRSVRR